MFRFFSFGHLGIGSHHHQRQETQEEEWGPWKKVGTLLKFKMPWDI